jgi:hypothetical protein
MLSLIFWTLLLDGVPERPLFGIPGDGNGDGTNLTMNVR